MFGRKKKNENNLSFDDLKNEKYNYYYSRKERLKNYKVMENKNPEKIKGIKGFFRGRKILIPFLIFYAVIFLILYSYFNFYDNLESLEKERVFSFDNKKSAEIKLIHNQNKHGLNIYLINNGENEWSISNLVFINSNWSTNISAEINLANSEFDVLFIDIPLEQSNIKSLLLLINKEE